jgi:hypothetical protein
MKAITPAQHGWSLSGDDADDRIHAKASRGAELQPFAAAAIGALSDAIARPTLRATR